MIYQIQSLPNNPITNKPYQFKMPPHLEGTHVGFHADLKKLIEFWEFDNMCLPSFIEENFHNPIASLNPDKNGVYPQTFENIEYGEKYENSYSKRENDKIECFYMPQVSHNDYSEFEIFDIKEIKKSSCFGLCKKTVLEKQIIAKSRDKVEFTNGRHRTRYFEFIGAKDIWIAIPERQLDWFNTYCKYEN